MAEAVFGHMVEEAGLGDRIEVDSAGTSALNSGRPAHRGTREVLASRGIVYHGSARRVTLNDVYEADYVIAMDRENRADLRRLSPREALQGKLYLLLGFAPGDFPREVPDPIYDGRFEETYRLVDAGCRGLLEHIRAAHQL
jgi:protein-tyrosine phosphatase